jgi:hypothetical protein
MDPITLDALTEVVAIIIAFLTTAYGLSQRAAKQISHNESATFAREVRSQTSTRGRVRRRVGHLIKRST